jgi:hypothetical protein
LPSRQPSRCNSPSREPSTHFPLHRTARLVGHVRLT